MTILIGNKIADIITKSSKCSLQNILVKAEIIGHNREIPPKIYLINEDRKLLIK